MSMQPASRPSQQPPAQRSAPAGAGAPAATLDPIRLLKQHKLTLAASVVVGAFLGIFAHFALMYVHPFYSSEVFYQVSPPINDIGERVQDTQNQDELDRFMATQVRIMASDRIFQEVVKDPKIRDTKWARMFVDSKGQFNAPDAALALRDYVSARMLSGTNLLSLSFTWKDRTDVATMVNAVHQAYWRDLSVQGKTSTAEQREALSKTYNDLDAELKRLDAQRENLLKDNSVNALEEGAASESVRMAQLMPQLVGIAQELEAYRAELSKYQAQMQSEGGVNFSDDLRTEVELSGNIQRIKAFISDVETAISSLRLQGFGDEHKEIKRLKTQLDAQQQQLETEREDMLQRMFNGRVEAVRTYINVLLLQQQELNKQLEEASRRREEFVRLRVKYGRLGDEILVATEQRSKKKQELDNLNAIAGLDTGDRQDRVRVLQRGQVPDSVTFPKLVIMLPLGVILVSGLVGTAVLVRELLDQRVKGPSDITMIPRVRLLGVVPLTREDPSHDQPVETAFRDQPMSAVSESFRHILAPLSKRMDAAGHRSLLVLGGMPGSGASTMVTNLAFASAAADRRVLVIDANFRRPSMHRIFGLSEGPGLGEILSRSATLESAVQATATPNLKVLTAGANGSRGVPERLSTELMARVIREASESYDLVLVDTAPVVVAGDGLALANRCDAVAVVVRAMGEKRGLVARIRDQLSDARAELMGVVVNGVRSAAGGYLKRNIKATLEYQSGKAA